MSWLRQCAVGCSFLAAVALQPQVIDGTVRLCRAGLATVFPAEKGLFLDIATGVRASAAVERMCSHALAPGPRYHAAVAQLQPAKGCIGVPQPLMGIKVPARA